MAFDTGIEFIADRARWITGIYWMNKLVYEEYWNDSFHENNNISNRKKRVEIMETKITVFFLMVCVISRNNKII
jgi:hypothetical protein